MYEAFNIKVQQNAFDILDALEPTNKTIWNKIIIPQWEYYWNSTPQAGNLSKRITVLPWYNSSLLKEWIPNNTDRKIALMYFWELPTRVANMEIYKYWFEVFDKYPRVYTEKLFREYVEKVKQEHPTLEKVRDIIYQHTGLDAMIYTIQQMPRVYNEVMSKYPNGTIGPWNEDPRNFYYVWLGDRAGLGLAATMGQFFGANETAIRNTSSMFEFMKIAKNGNGIDQFLEKNWKYWDLIKFIYGYGVCNFGGDNMKYDNLYLPIAMKAFGIPHSNRGVYHESYVNGSCRFVAGPEDIIFGLPDYVLEPLKQGKYGEVLILPGNGFSCIGSPLYGIKQDLAYGQQNPVEPNLKCIEIYLPLRENKIYFFRSG
jgi:hypothetical protein